MGKKSIRKFSFSYSITFDMFREIGNRGHPAMISPNDPRQRLCLCASAEISRELKVDTAESSIIALEPFHGGVLCRRHQAEMVSSRARLMHGT